MLLQKAAFKVIRAGFDYNYVLIYYPLLYYSISWMHNVVYCQVAAYFYKKNLAATVQKLLFKTKILIY